MLEGKTKILEHNMKDGFSKYVNKEKLCSWKRCRWDLCQEEA